MVAANRIVDKPLRSFRMSVVTANEVLDERYTVADPVIENVVRVGEVASLIAPPKVGKSWLVLDMALSVASESPWLGFGVTSGRVLLVDNELDMGLLSERIKMVSHARGIKRRDFGDRLDVVCLRGSEIPTIHELANHLIEECSGKYRLIILDAWYKFIPSHVNENDNQEMASSYAAAARLAAECQCAVILVHHSSKGSQAKKAITDVGSGAGTQSRSVDTHMVLREHKVPGAFVLDAVTRSWKDGYATRVLLKELPLWVVDHELHHGDLAMSSRSSKPAKNEKRVFTYGEFRSLFVSRTPRTRSEITSLVKDNPEWRSVGSRTLKGFFDRFSTDDYVNVDRPTCANKPTRFSLVEAPF